MQLAAVVEILQATQQAQGDVRKAAEKKLDEAAATAPDQLVEVLGAVLAAGAEVPEEVRQQAAVILRQIVAGTVVRDEIWLKLQFPTKTTLEMRLLTALEADMSGPVRRAAGQVVSAIANKEAEDFDELVAAWPEVMPTISRLVACGDVGRRVVALGVLRDLVTTAGSGMLSKGGGQLVELLAATFEDQAPDVRAAGCKLLLALIEELTQDEAAPLAQAMPALVNVIQGFANNSNEEQLKDTLTALTSAVDEEPAFFKDISVSLWATLTKLCALPADAFADAEARTQAMESAMSLAIGLSEELSKPEGSSFLEQIVGLNITWMLEVEEDVNVWTAEGKDTDDDECDGDAVGVGEENIDRLAETIGEEVFMPILFKMIRECEACPDASWKHARSCVMALSQSVEHVEETAWVDQCLGHIGRQLTHAHPRVRYAAHFALSQICYDHSDHVASLNDDSDLLGPIITGMKDSNVRVATASMNAFLALGEELEHDDLEEHIDEALVEIFARLRAKESRILQEHAISAVAIIADVSEEAFQTYYGDVMPMLKQVIEAAASEAERELRAKAFMCVPVVGQAVGKEMFVQDAKEVMAVMMQLAQAGFAADDPQREAVSEASGKIAAILGKDFKAYVPALLPGIFSVLAQRPKEIPEDAAQDSDDEEDMSLTIVGDKVLGLKTSVLTEMEESLELIQTLIAALEDEFCEFLPTTCEQLLPLLELTLSEDLREQAFKTWGFLTSCAKAAVERSRLDAGVLRGIVTEFLKKIIGGMLQQASADATVDEALIGNIQAQATGVAAVIHSAGQGVLAADVVKDIAAVLVQLLVLVTKQCGQDASAELAAAAKTRRKKGAPVAELDEDGEEKEIGDDDKTPTPQSLRFCLADALCALMKASREEFAEVALPSYMEFVRALIAPDGGGESSRALAFYIADDVVENMGERSVPYWNGFLNTALAVGQPGTQDKSPIVRQYAAATLGNAAQASKAFAPMAGAAVSQLFGTLQKHGERHRRRRAVNAESKQSATAVDSSIRALGQILEHHEAELGAHVGKAWSMWISSLPLKYDVEAGLKAHAQLLALAAKRHAAVVAPEEQAKVLSIFVEIYKTKFSNKELDAGIALAVAGIGEAPLKQLGSNFPERTQKKIEKILKSAQKMGGA